MQVAQRLINPQTEKKKRDEMVYMWASSAESPWLFCTCTPMGMSLLDKI